MKDKCSFCGNEEVVAKKVQYIYRHDGKFLVVDDVPCEECTYCHERYFEGAVLEQIEDEFEALHSGAKTARSEVSVPIEKYTEFAS